MDDLTRVSVSNFKKRVGDAIHVLAQIARGVAPEISLSALVAPTETGALPKLLALALVDAFPTLTVVRKGRLGSVVMLKPVKVAPVKKTSKRA